MRDYTQTGPLALFNLRESPYFQEALQASGRYPLSLFIGRSEAADLLLKKIQMSPGGTRQTIRGPVGVGKSTLAQYVKQRSKEWFGLLSATRAASLGSAATADQLCALILRSVLEALLVGAGERGTSIHNDVTVQEASQLVRIYQKTTGFSGGVSVMAVGANIGESTTLVTPSAATPFVVVQDLLPKLIEIARTQLGAEGILVHLNNMESLTEADAKRAAQILRDIRDPALMQDGYHWILVGTTEAVKTVVDAQPQLRTVFHRPPVLRPLSDPELAALLDLRYKELRLDTEKDPRRPVDPDAVATLYQLFSGDLRGTFEALDAAVVQLLGASASGPDAPLTLNDMTPFLTGWARERAIGDLGAERAEQLEQIALIFRADPFTRAQLQESVLHLVNRRVTGEFLDTLTRYGYLIEHSERLDTGGRPATRYITTGTSRLLAGAMLLQDPAYQSYDES